MDRERNQKRTVGIRRYFVASRRTSSVQVIPFEDMIKTEHTVRISDLSVVGVGIESDDMIRPGLIWFQKPVSGQRFGVVTWCKRIESGYRAGVHFIVLPSEDERYIMNQLKQAQASQVLCDPESVIRSLFNSIRNRSEGQHSPE